MSKFLFHIHFKDSSCKLDEEMSHYTDNEIIRRCLIGLISIWKRSKWKTIGSQRKSVQSSVMRSSDRHCELSLLLIHYGELSLRQHLQMSHQDVCFSVAFIISIDSQNKHTCTFTCVSRLRWCDVKMNCWDNLNLLHKVHFKDSSFILTRQQVRSKTDIEIYKAMTLWTALTLLPLTLINSMPHPICDNAICTTKYKDTRSEILNALLDLPH